jgi:hypothetical protein
MGRIGVLRDRWSAWSRPRRIVVASVVVLTGIVAGAGVAGSHPKHPAQVVWHDQLADPTTTTASPVPGGTSPTVAPTAAGATTTDPGAAGSDGIATLGSSATTGPSARSRPTTSSGPSTGGTTGGPSTTVPADALAGLRVAAEGPRTGYNRNLFGDWIDADHDRCDTREEVLQAQSSTPPQTDYSGTACKVMAGDWVSLYDGAVLTDRTEVEIDHVVALAEAWDSGASAWDATRRHDFANDLAHPELLAVSSSTNHAKGDRDPAEWTPPRTAAQCAFASDWVAVKVAWNLSADPAEVTALRRMLATCPGGRPAPTPAPASTPTGGSSTSPTTSGPTVTTSTTVPAAASGLVEVVGLDCPGEGVTVRNGGSGSADLSGWSIHDAGDKHTFAFPSGYHLAPGASVTVRSGGPAGAGELQWPSSTSPNASVWNNDGDTATLVDAAGATRSTRSC